MHDGATRRTHFDLRYDRTPLQFSMLCVATFGLYVIFWVGRARYVCQVRSGRTPTPWWHTLGLLVPLVGLFVYYTALTEIESYAKEGGAKLAIPAAVLGVASGVVYFLARLHEPYLVIAWFGFVPLLPLHTALWRAESGCGRFPGRARLSPYEIVLLVVGFVFLAFAALGIAFEADNRYAGAIAVGALAALAAVFAVARFAVRNPVTAGSAATATYPARGRRTADPSTILSWLAGLDDGVPSAMRLAHMRAAAHDDLVVKLASEGSLALASPAIVQRTALAFSGWRTPAFGLPVDGAADIARIAAANALAQVQATGMSPALAEAGARAVSCEIATASVEGRVADALALCDFGMSTYPSAAAVVRRRGILRVATGDTAGLADLEAVAQATAAEFGAAEALEWARDAQSFAPYV